MKKNKSNKRICIISMGNLYLVPYLSLYTSKIKGPYSIIYWDRENINEQYEDAECLRFFYEIKNKYDKLFGYYKYRKFVIKKIKSQKYDQIIMLQTLGALLINDILKAMYYQKYIVDIRDYTYEYIKPIFNIEKELLKYSNLNIISSEGYLSFLPPDIEYVIAHNIRNWSRSQLEFFNNKKKSKNKLNIAFIGYISYQEQHKKLLMSVKNDERIHITFIGTRSEDLKEFCELNDIKNVTLKGSFEPSKILKLYEEVDLINNLYGNNTPVLDYALSNKLYYAAQLKIPILVCENTYMEKIANEYGIGFSVNMEINDLPTYLVERYNNINWELFEEGCEKFLTRVYEQQSVLEKKIEEIVN